MPLRYVILRHQNIDEPHYDLMFETIPGSSLATWRSPAWPIESPTDAVKLRDHRRAFLDYQGELTGNRGQVIQVAAGTCQIIISEYSSWKIRLLSGSLPVVLSFRQVDGQHWSVEKSDVAD